MMKSLHSNWSFSNNYVSQSQLILNAYLFTFRKGYLCFVEMLKLTSLFKFGFKRRIQHRGQLLEVSGEDFVKDTRPSYKCQVCNKTFQSK